jgi:hypothetical protein
VEHLWSHFRDGQRRVCDRFGAPYEPIDPQTTLGVSLSLLGGKLPFNGLRHPPERGTNGWYVWGGEEFPRADDAFEPLHAFHLIEQRREVVPYLALGPGWRFLIAAESIDVWEDSSLLDI